MTCSLASTWATMSILREATAAQLAWKAVALVNMYHILVTMPVFQLPRGWLKVLAD